ncbi:hypothetical protein ACOSP7_015512 [Xanthoceras sorbifolium]
MFKWFFEDLFSHYRYVSFCLEESNPLEKENSVSHLSFNYSVEGDHSINIFCCSLHSKLPHTSPTAFSQLYVDVVVNGNQVVVCMIEGRSINGIHKGNIPTCCYTSFAYLLFFH